MKTIKNITTACPLDCFGACRIKVDTIENDIIKLEADPDHPVTRGIFCSKGRSHLKRMLHPNRLERPMLKTAEGFKPISWEEAMQFLTEKMQTALDQHGHQSIAGFTGGAAGGKLKDVMDLFLRHLGGGTGFSGGLCLSAGLQAQTLDFGNALGHSPNDLINAKTIVLWGKNPADTHFHLLPYIKEARQAGTRVILIDPIATATTRFADVVIQPLPGTDWALALVVLQKIINRGLSNEGLSAQIQTHHPELLRAILEFEMEALVRCCGVSEEGVETLADAYGVNAPCATYLGYGLQRHTFGGTTVRLIDLLGALSGQVGIPGGGVNYGNFVNRGLLDWSWSEPNFEPHTRFLSLGDFGKALLEVTDPPVKLLMIACGNPATQMSDANHAVTALQEIETVVVIDHFMTDTAKHGDIVLPATYFLESEDIMAANMWNSSIHYMPQVVEPRGEARSELSIFSELALRLNLNQFPQLTPSEWLSNLLKPLASDGIHLDHLMAEGWLPSPRQVDVPWQNHRFQTDDGQFHPLSGEVVRQLKAHVSEIQNFETVALVTRHRIDSINSQHTEAVSHIAPEIHLHPSTADHFGFAEGEVVEVYSDSGSVTCSVKRDAFVKPGVAAALQGTWRHGENGSFNDVIGAGSSDIGGQVLLNAMMVTISKKESKM